MITGTAKLVVDLGNSETRVKTIYGKTAKGNVRERLSILDNRYSIVPDEKLDLYLKGDTYSSESSYVFERNGIYYCNGDVCNIEMAQTSLKRSMNLRLLCLRSSMLSDRVLKMLQSSQIVTATM